MKAYKIHLVDIGRILFGATPPTFLLEVIVRTAVVYIILMASMRTMGKRMSSQLSRNELAAMVSLAAAIGIPIQDPERGILPAVVIAIIIVSFQRWFAYKAATNQTFESKTQGRLSILVQDGILNLKNMESARMSKDRLFAKLRSYGLLNLGPVARLYFEANASFSWVRNKENKPGLCLIPSWDDDFRREMVQRQDKWACSGCGRVEDTLTSKEAACVGRGGRSWEKAVETPGVDSRNQ